MCGIAGILGVRRELAEPALARMRHAINHRGPDDRDTVFIDSPAGTHPIGFAHTRLAIIDLSDAGLQPMSNEDGSLHVTFNGEIYNYLELRSELIGHGHLFRSHTDTEVLLHGYEQWGMEGLLGRLRGMFALAIWDGRSPGTRHMIEVAKAHGLRVFVVPKPPQP